MRDIGGRVLALALLQPASLACTANQKEAEVRWSEASDRLYVENGGCIDLDGVVDKMSPDGPLYHFDKEANTVVSNYTGTFILQSSLHVYRDTLLEVVGEEFGGTSNELLLSSDSSKWIELRAHGGQLLFQGTKVFSWDMNAADYRRDSGSGRSSVSAITEVITNGNETCEGMATGDMGEAQMDIYDSEMGYLGYEYKESYGVAWKARGLCVDLSNIDIFDTVAVRGNLMRSEIHHNFFGHYSYGHQGGNWSNNHVHHNAGYGFDPHDDSDDLTIHNNVVHDNGWDGIIASKRCDNVSIVNNEVYNNGQNGIMLHRSSDNGVIMYNIVRNNSGAGIAIHETAYTVISNNYVANNKYGIRWNVGASRTACSNNVIRQSSSDNHSYAIYFYEGSDEPEVNGSDGHPKNNYVGYNILSRGKDEVVKVLDADYNIIEHNMVEDGVFFSFENSTNNFVRNNTFEQPLQDGDWRYHVGENACFAPGSDRYMNLTLCT